VVYEGAFPASNAGAFRRYIGGVAIATFYQATGIDQTRYQHTDHLGSVTALSDEGGQIAAQMAFDPWGQRRNGNDWNTVWQQWTMGMTPVWAQSAIDITPRGYTGHEHVDEMGIIHMNGRIYDALLGRFLQADPFVEDSTTLNRYTYVHNNPLSLTDPSGFFSFKKAFKLAAVVAISVYTGGLAQAALLAKEFALGFTYAVLGGALAGGISAGGIEGAVWGAFSGAVFFGIGVGFNQVADPTGGLFATGLSGPEFAAQSISHGLAGGTISEMQGGKFGHGFLSAGISKAATPGVAASPLNNYQQGFVLAIIGGTTSKISGGKFANGAVTAAMAFAFNQLTQEVGKLTRIVQRKRQLAELTKEEFEVLFDVNITDDLDLAIHVLALDQELTANYLINDAKALGDAARDIIESEYKSAGLVGARRLKAATITAAVSKATGIDPRHIKGFLRSQRVISEIGSIEPTLKGVAQGLLDGDERVREVFFDD